MIFVTVSLFLVVSSFAEAAEGDMTTYTGTGPQPFGIAFDGTNMWTANANIMVQSNSVTKISPTGTMTTYTGTGNGPKEIAFDGTNMWTANNASWPGSVTKITPTGAMTTYVGTGNNPHGIAFDGTNMWTASYVDNSVTKISPTGTMTTYNNIQPYASASSGSFKIAFDGTNMWVVISGGVTKITPTGVKTTYTGFNPYSIAFDGTNMWTTGNGEVTKITPTGAITNYGGNFGNNIAFDGTNMWTRDFAGSVTKITPTGAMTTYTGTGSGAGGIAFDGSSMWTANWMNNSVTKISVRPVGTINASSNIPSASWNITGPATILGSGLSQSSPSKPVGMYTITWGAVSGYTTPAPQTLTLISGSTIAFNGVYTSSTLKMCPISCTGGGTPYDTLTSFPADAEVTLYACYGPGVGVCSPSEVSISGVWAEETTPPNNAIDLTSLGGGTSVTVRQNSLGNATENITLSHPAGIATLVDATAAVSCAALTCDSLSIALQRNSYCPSESRKFDNNCGGQTAACDGRRNCNYNWIETAP